MPQRFPWTVVGAGGLLLVCGWLGLARCDELAAANGGALGHELVWSAAAVVAAMAAAATNYRLAARLSYLALGCAVFALVAVYLFPAINGAHRWIRIGPVGFQPSEFAKLALVLALARYLTYRELRNGLVSLLPPLALTLLPVWLVLKEPDLGTSLVFLPVLFAMLFAAGARRRHLLALALVGLAALPALWSQMSRDQRSRVTALWEQPRPGQSPTPASYHLQQAQRMFALGGFWGSAFDEESDEPGDTIERRVPEAQTDSIFAVIGERYGVVGCSLVLLLYCVLIWRGLAIAQETREPFGRLIVVGVMAMIGFQVVINAGMLAGLLPITGLPLPLVSYGGSGLIANALGLGLVISISLRPGYEMA